ncbi:hypothetical protein [Luteolibacter soli]|uniref:Uncharacterized protein n=1 Tax=Luteolibacter soli TaxID=3135280 RepID=A0ABU9B1L7_9BACT
MKPKVTITGVLGIWLCVSLVAGMCLTQVPWGKPDGFHGTGFPFAQVYWDLRPGTGQMIDYPNPLAPALNVAAVAVTGAAVILATWWSLTLFQRFRKRRASTGTSE